MVVEERTSDTYFASHPRTLKTREVLPIVGLWDDESGISSQQTEVAR
jgi:hypothetical protein